MLHVNVFNSEIEEATPVQASKELLDFFQAIETQMEYYLDQIDWKRAVGILTSIIWITGRNEKTKVRNELTQKHLFCAWVHAGTYTLSA